MVIPVYEKSQIAQLCQSFFKTMSRLSQVQCKITVSMLVNGASINALAQHFYVHCNMISRLHTCFHHSVIICDRQRSGQPRVTTPAEYRYIHKFTLRNRFRNAALASRNIPSRRRLTGQTVRLVGWLVGWFLNVLVNY